MPDSVDAPVVRIPEEARDVPDDWTWHRLDAVCKDIFDCPHSTPQKADVGPLMARTQDVMTGVFRADQAQRVSEETYADRIKRGEPRVGDLMYSREGTYFGVAAEVPPKTRVCLGQRMVLIRADSELVYFRYLRYWLNSPVMASYIHGFRDGSVAERLNVSTIRGLPTLVPPLRQQVAIGSILGALDDKIELNRRMNATLESLARAIFKSWFVDFEPVKMKAARTTPVPQNETQAVASHLTPEILDLFPSSFQESELGPIPDGWIVDRFANHITVTRGLSYNGSGLADEGVPMHNLNSIYEGGGYKHEGIKYYTGEYGDRHMVVPGDLIATNTEQGFEHRLIGFAALVPARYGNTGIYSHHIYRIRMKQNSPLSSHYLLRLINSPRWHSWIAGFSNGTTINMLPTDALELPLLVVPPAELVEAYTELAANIAGQIEDSILESESLAATRDTLLPRLLSGDLPVDKFQWSNSRRGLSQDTI
jgi:type I restriction enzyme S subunit